MDHERRGTAIIINNRRFDAKLDMPTREGKQPTSSQAPVSVCLSLYLCLSPRSCSGSDKDAASLEFSFRKLGVGFLRDSEASAGDGGTGAV